MSGQSAEKAQTFLVAFDKITEAASLGDWTRHLPNCGYTHEVPECGCAEWGGRVYAVLGEALAQAWGEGWSAGASRRCSTDNPYLASPPAPEGGEH